MDTSDRVKQVKRTDIIMGEDIHIRSKWIHLYNRISFDAYNEGDYDEFEAVVEKYHERFGYYLERIFADKMYRSRKNG